MNRIVLLMETGRAAVQEAAKWFLAHGDSVYLGVRELPETQLAGTDYLVFDPCCEACLQAAVNAVEEKHGRLDILVIGAAAHPADGVIGTGHDYDEFLETMLMNTYGGRMTAEAFVPLLRRGMKRIASITGTESSNSWSTGKTDIAYHASVAALNMTGKLLFNALRPEGFTFRWYCDDGMPGGMCAAEYITSALSFDPDGSYNYSDENRMVMRDAYLREISW